MKKIFSFLTAILFAGSMWATPVEGTISLGNAEGAWNATTSDSFTDENELSWNRTVSAGGKASIQGGICQFGNSSNACTSLIFSTTIGSAVTLSQFEADFVGGASKTAGTIKLYSGTSELASATVSGTASVTCKITKDAKVSSTEAIKVEYTGTNGSIKIAEIRYTYAVPTTNPAVSFVDGDTKAISSYELAAAGETDAWALAYSNIKEDSEGANPDVAVYSNAACTTEFDGDWFEAVAVGANSVMYSADANETGAARTVYVVFSNTAKNASDGDVNLTDTLTVSQPTLVLVTSVSVKKATELEVGETETLTATVLPEGASDKTVTWASTATSVATVDENGKITAVAPGTAKISATANDASGLSDTCVVTVIAALETSTLSFTEAYGDGPAKADDDVEWTVASDGSESSFDNTKGIHYGTGKAAVKYIQLSSSDITGTIKKITVNASTANDVSATVSVTVGEKAFGGAAQTLSSSATDYTFTGSAKGAIVVTITKPSSANGALYCKSIVVKYDDTTTALDNTEAGVKAVKKIVNGQLLIEKNGRVYNAFGQTVK